MRRGTFAAQCLVGSMALTTTSFAQSTTANPTIAQSPAPVPSASDTLLREGVELRRAGRDTDALDRFTRAYAADHSPIALAQMGLAEQALGHWVDSEAHVRAALDIHGNAWIDQNREAIEAAYATIRSHVGLLELQGAPRGATVAINGQRVATLPVAEPIHVPVGEIRLAVTAPGYLAVGRTVVIAPGATAHERIEMDRSARESNLLLPFAYASGGLAVAGLVTGIVGAAVRESAVTAYNNDPSCPGTTASFQPSACRGRIDLGQSMRTVEIVGFVGAGAFAVASATLFYFGSRANATRSEARIAQWTCEPALGEWGVFCRGRF